jgi:hypothetical protein
MKKPKIRVNDTEMDLDEGLEKALEDFDASVAANKKASKGLSDALKRRSLQPPALDELAEV